MNKKQLPIGFSMALAMNPEAMQAFARLNEQEQQALIDGTHAVTWKVEMHAYVQSIADKHKTP